MINSVKNRTSILTFLGGIIYVVLYLSFILKSPYVGDDTINSIASGFIYKGDFSSLFEMSLFYAKQWIEVGRLYPLSFLYMYFLFSYCKTLFIYKLFLVFVTLINLVLFYKLISYINKQDTNRISIFFLFPMFCPLIFYYDNPLFAYHGLLQLVLGCWIISVIFGFAASTVSGEKRYFLITLGVLAYGIALLTYEVAFLLIIITCLLFIFKYKNWKSAIGFLSPYLVLWVILALFYISLAFTKGANYAGVKPSYDFSLVCITFLKQILPCIPLYSYFMFNRFGDFHVLFKYIPWQGVLAILIFLIESTFVLCHYNDKQQRVIYPYSRELIIIGLLLLTLPAIPIAFSTRYQAEIQWGGAWLPQYISNYGFLLLGYVLVTQLFQYCYKKNNVFVVATLLFTLSALILLNFTVANYSLRQRIQPQDVYRKNLTNAIRLGLLKNVDQKSTLLVLPASSFDTYDTSAFYSNYAKKKINAHYLNNDIKTVNTGHRYALWRLDELGNAIIVGRIKNGSTYDKIILNDLYIFITKQNTNAVLYFSNYMKNGSKEITKINLKRSACLNAAQSLEGQIYCVRKLNDIKLSSIRLDKNLKTSYQEPIIFSEDKKHILVDTITGLSGIEPWGRWSDSNINSKVTIDFMKTLPEKFELQLEANAFDPNIHKDLKVIIANKIYNYTIPSARFKMKLPINLNGARANKITIVPPFPASPAELKLSDDTRKLGIGFIRLLIEEK